MIEFYPQLKAVHLGCVVASGTVFTARGLLMLGRSPWSMATAVRWASYTIDTGLLVSALILIAILHPGPISQPWLWVKLALLVAYIITGSFALKRARSASGRRIAFIVALVIFAAMYGIARAHHPLGWLRWWGWA